MSTQVSCTIDLAAAGKQVGRLQLPRISNTGGWAYSFVPIATIANGEGPTVVVSAGNHGDEYEGQIALLRLLQEDEWSPGMEGVEFALKEDQVVGEAERILRLGRDRR